MHLVGFDPQRLRYRVDWQRICATGHPHEQRLNDRQRERQANRERGAQTSTCLDIDRTVDLLDVGTHHVHADPPSRHVAEPVGGAEAGREDQLHCLRIGQPVRLLRRNDAPFDSFALDRLNIDAFTVILERNDDEAVRVSGREPQTARTGLATCHPLRRRLDAMVDGITNQVQQRIADLLDD